MLRSGLFTPLLLFLLAYLPGHTLFGQALMPSDAMIRGKILNDSTGRAIPFAHLFNESNRFGTISDKNGNFSIPGSHTDTLVVSALGYLARVVYMNDNLYKKSTVVRLFPVVYEIEAVDIISFRDYEHFKKAFVALDLSDTPQRQLRESLQPFIEQAAEEGAGRGEMVQRQLQPNIRPVKGNITLYSKEDLQRMNLEKVKSQEKRQHVIDEKFNRDIVAQVTKLESDEEITEFMGFCNFTEDFLYQANLYEILVEIERKFKAFKRAKEGGIWLDGSYTFGLDLT